jgi:hypothetical protein
MQENIDLHLGSETAGATGAARRWRLMLVVAMFALIVAAAMAMHISEWKDEYLGSDIRSIYEMSRELSQGTNPYDRILPGRRDDHKYATYLPLFYIFGALIHNLGAQDYKPWIQVWRVFNLAANIGIGTLLFAALYQRKLLLVALFATLFWFFNRWTLYITVNAQIDLLPVFCMVASLLVFRDNRRLSFLLLGTSLALKHISIFVVPLYLIWIWQSSDHDRLGQVVRAAIWIAALPVILSLPFVFWNAEAFRASMIYSLDREPTNHFKVASFDELLTVTYPWFTGILARLPLIAMMLLIYLGTLRRQIPLFFGALLVISVFIDFNSVLFRQYLTWLVPLVPLALCDVVDSLRAGQLAQGSMLPSRSDLGQGAGGA